MILIDRGTLDRVYKRYVLFSYFYRFIFLIIFLHRQVYEQNSIAHMYCTRHRHYRSFQQWWMTYLATESVADLHVAQRPERHYGTPIHTIKLMKGKALRKHSLHEKIAASVLLKLFISGNE